MVEKNKDEIEEITDDEVQESDSNAQSILGQALSDDKDVTDILGGFKIAPQTLESSSAPMGGKSVLAALSGLSKGFRSSKAQRMAEDITENKVKIAEDKAIREKAIKDRDFALKHFGSETNLRKEFTKDYKKTFDDITSKTEQTINALTSANAPDNVVAIMNFMKALDPGSVVRESEFKLIPEMSGIYNKVTGILKKNIKGEGVLTTQVRKDMVDSIGKLYEVYKDQFEGNRDEYVRLGKTLSEAVDKSDSYNPSNVVGVSEILDSDFYNPIKIVFEEENEDDNETVRKELKIN